MKSLYESILDATEKKVKTSKKSFGPAIKQFLKENYKGTFTVSKGPNEDGFYVVYGGPVEQAFHRTNFSTDAGVLRFMRILRYNGVEEKLKAAGIKDGDSVRVCDYEFDYFE